MKARLLGAAIFGACVAPLAAGLVSAGCSGTTGSARFAFQASAGGAPRGDGATAGPLAFVNEKGWLVTLDKATVTLGPLYVNTVPPLSGQQTWRSVLPALVPVAHAAGASHLGEGRIVGEVLGQVTFDGLAPALVPFAATGTMTGEQVRTTELCFFPPPGTPIDTPSIDQVAVDLAGSAAKDGATVRFRGALIFDDAWRPDPKPGVAGTSMIDVRTVRGIPASFFPREGGALELRMDVRRLFTGADFSALADSPEDADGTKILVQSKSGKYTTDQVMRNVFAGTTQAATYAIRWIDPG